MKQKKPVGSKMYATGGVRRYTEAFRRGTPGFDEAIKLVGQGMGAPFYNVPSVGINQAGRISGLAGDTSDPSLLTTGWKQGPTSSIVETFPFMMHAVADDSEARTGAILGKIAPGSGTQRHLQAQAVELDSNELDKFNSLMEWQHVANSGLIRIDALFESFVLTGLSPEDVGKFYVRDMNEIRVATEADISLSMQRKDTGKPVAQPLVSVSDATVGIRMTSETFPGVTLGPGEIKVALLGGGTVGSAAVGQIDTPVYAAVVHAYWSGLSPSLKNTQEAIARVEGPMGISVEKFKLTSLALAVQELRDPETLARKRPTATLTEPTEPAVVPIPPGVTVVPTQTVVDLSSTKRWRSSKVLASETTLALEKKLPTMTIEFLRPQPPAAEHVTFLIRESRRPRAEIQAMTPAERSTIVDEIIQQTRSTIVASDVPLRKANTTRYPNLPYEFYYGIWYHNRAMGFFPKESRIQVPRSANDRAPSVIIPLRGRTRVGTPGRTTVFSYDLRNRRLDDAYDLTVEFPAGRGALTLGLKRDEPGLAAVQTVSVSREVVEA